jgi:hypothetical protein
MSGVVGAKVPFQKFKCGGWTGCEADHNFLAPEDVMLVEMAIPNDHFEEHGGDPEKLTYAIEHKLAIQTETAVIPTVLGLWVEDAAAN